MSIILEFRIYLIMVAVLSFACFFTGSVSAAGVTVYKDGDVLFGWEW